MNEQEQPLLNVRPTQYEDETTPSPSRSKCCKASLIIYNIVAVLILNFVCFLWLSEAVAEGYGCPYGVQNFAHRGYTSAAQENSLDAVTVAVDLGYGAEFDIFLSTDNVFIAFHDENFLNLTGEDLDITNASWDVVKNFEYLETIHGYSYGVKRPVASLEQILNAVCDSNPNALMNLDLKGKPDKEFGELLSKVVDESSCACNIPN